MRHARAQDYWRNTYSNDYDTELLSIKFEEVPTIGTIELSLGKGISAITGLNGVGKSTILHVIWLCLCDEASEQAMALNTRLDRGRAVLSVMHDNVKYELSYCFENKCRQCVSEVGEDEPDIFATLVDLADIAPTLQRYVRKDPNVQDLIDQEESYTLSSDELNFVKHLMYRGYTRIDIYELEIDLGLDNKWSSFPYFYVERNGNRYGVEHLGLGGLSGLLVFWSIFRKKKNSILLLDEPESYLSAQFQMAISDLIAYAAAERNISTVLASHSDLIVNRIPPERRIITLATPQGMKCTNAQRSPEHLSVLCQSKDIKYVFVVEDRAAMILLKEMLSKYSPIPLRSIEVCYAGSASEVVKSLNDLIDGFDYIDVKFIGVLDGDQESVRHQCNKILYYLPGKKDPEEVVRDAIAEYSLISATSFGVEQMLITAAVEKNEGCDYHDWPHAFGREIGKTYSQVIEVGARIYINNVLDIRHMKAFIDRLIK